jgi:hypothetical protein
MEADFGVELGANDETLEFPWSASSGCPRYYDLKRHPELLGELDEVRRTSELAVFLRALNSPASALESAKCDAWFTSETDPEEESFGASCKYGCYVDLLFSNDSTRFSFSEHEAFAKSIVQLLKKAPEIPASGELLIRRCFYHRSDGTREGFYITCYVFGYGDDESEARQRWSIALELVANAIRQNTTATN